MCWGYTEFSGRFLSNRSFKRLIFCDYVIPSVLSRPCHWLANIKLEHCPEHRHGKKCLKCRRGKKEYCCLFASSFLFYFPTTHPKIVIVPPKIVLESMSAFSEIYFSWLFSRCAIYYKYKMKIKKKCNYYERRGILINEFSGFPWMIFHPIGKVLVRGRSRRKFTGWKRIFE